MGLTLQCRIVAYNSIHLTDRSLYCRTFPVRSPHVPRTGNWIGDACDGDTDGDGVGDELDMCQHDPLMQTTTFRDHVSVVLYPGAGNESDPRWLVLDEGAEVAQVEDTTIPAMLIGEI